MKEAVSAFNSEFFTPIATVAIPGAIAIWPAFVWEFTYHDNLQEFVTDDPAITGVGLFVIAIGAGLILEVIGGFFEAYISDCLARLILGSVFDETWHAYQRLAFKVEAVGQHYLRTRVMMLKFLLGISLALFVQALGVWYLFEDRSSFIRIEQSKFVWASVIVGILLLIASFQYTWLLHRVRENLLKPITVIGCCDEDHAHGAPTGAGAAVPDGPALTPTAPPTGGAAAVQPPAAPVPPRTT